MSLDSLCPSDLPPPQEDCFTPFLPFQQRIANKRKSNLNISYPSLNQSQPLDQTSMQQDVSSPNPTSTLPQSQQPSLRRHVLIRNALLHSIRQDRNERLNQMKLAYYLPDQDALPLQSSSSLESKGPNGLHLSEQDGMAQVSSEGNSMALKEAREEVKREMKRELRVRNTTEPFESSSGSSSDSDEDEEEDAGEGEVGYDSDESLSDSEEYYRVRNQRSNPSQPQSLVSTLPIPTPRRTISSLTCSASVFGTSSRPSESGVQYSRPSVNPLQRQATSISRSDPSPQSSSRPKLSPVQRPSLSSTRPSLSATRPSLSLIKEQTISNPIRPTLSSSSRPGLQRTSPSVQKSIKIPSSSDEEDESNYGKVYKFTGENDGKRVSNSDQDEETEEEWFDELLNELGTNQQRTSQPHQISDRMEGVEMENQNEDDKMNSCEEKDQSQGSISPNSINGNLSLSPDSPNSPLSFSLSDSDSSELSMGYPNSLDDGQSNLNSNSNSNSIPSTITTPSLSNSNLKASSSFNSNSNAGGRQSSLTSELQFGISAWREKTRKRNNDEQDEEGLDLWKGRSFSYQDERIEKIYRDERDELDHRDRISFPSSLFRSNSDSLLM